MSIESAVQEYIYKGTLENEQTKQAFVKSRLSAKELQSSALHFLKIITENEWNRNSQIQNISSADPEQLKTIMENHFKLNQNQIKMASFDFQSKLDNFLEREIILAYVGGRGNIYFYQKEEEQKIIEQSTKTGGSSTSVRLAGWKIRNKNTKNLNAFLKEYGDQFEDFKTHHANVKRVFSTALRRFNETAKLHREKKNGRSYSQNNFIYWHFSDSNRKRIYAFVTNRGVIKEAYMAAAFDLNEQNKAHFNGPVDPRGLIYFYYNFIREVDNRPGSVSGDIAKDILDPIQFAVKSNNASSQSLLTLIDIAKYIIASPIENLNKNNLKEWMDRVFPNSKLIKNTSKELTSEAIKALNEEFKGLEIEYASISLEKALEQVGLKE